MQPQRSTNGLFEPKQYWNSREALINKYGNFNCGEIDEQIRLAQARQLLARRHVRSVVDERYEKA